MLKYIKHIHFIGIKGVAMSGLAIIAKQIGIKVTGTDVAEEFVTENALKRNRIKYNVGFSAKNIQGHPDLVIVTGAHGGMTNPEVKAAKKKGLKVVMNGEAIGIFMQDRYGISIAGCHGKTTTTAMMATVLQKAGLNPSFLAGCGSIPALKTHAKAGKGKYFIVEADEYSNCPLTDPTPRFLYQTPKIIVVTNIEFDHPDRYKTIGEIKKVFISLIKRLPQDGLLIAYGDDENVREVIKKTSKKTILYGTSCNNDWYLKEVRFEVGKTLMKVGRKDRKRSSNFELKVLGRHNALNALAVIIAANHLGVGIKNIRKALLAFTGTMRRFEFIGQARGVRVYDDYAHHPTEITTTLKATREWFGNNRIICIFQPHTFSRTQFLFKGFAQSFNDANEVILADIYPSTRERKIPGVNSKLLTQAVKKHHHNVIYGGSMENVVKYVGRNAKRGDIIITMGAGDIVNYHHLLLKNIRDSQ